MSGRQNSGGHGLAKPLALSAALGLLTWLLVSSAAGTEFTTLLPVLGAAVMAAGVVAGVLLIRWAGRFADGDGREGGAQPAKIHVDSPRHVIVDDREDDWKQV